MGPGAAPAAVARGVSGKQRWPPERGVLGSGSALLCCREEGTGAGLTDGDRGVAEKAAAAPEVAK